MFTTENISNFREILRLLEREIDLALRDETTCCGVSLCQCHTLLEINKQNSTNIKSLSDSFELDKSTMSRVVDGLVNIGLVDRIIDDQDRRFMKITLTENGKKSCETINQLCNNYYLRIFKNIPEEKHQIVYESIKLLAKSMNQVRKEDSEKDINTIKN